MSPHKQAASLLVGFLHALDPASKHLNEHTAFMEFLEAGFSPPDLNAAIVAVEAETGFGMSDLTDPESFYTMTPVEFCLLGLEKGASKAVSVREMIFVVADIYRDHILSIQNPTDES
jgi:hypothetical protein